MSLNTDDKRAIEDLMARFYRAVDMGDAQGFVDTFASDGVFVIRRGDAASPSQDVVGTEALSKHSAVFVDAKRTKTRHFVTNYVMEPCAEGVRVFSNILNVEIMDGPSVIGTADGDCIARKEGGEWKFARWDHFIHPAYMKHGHG